MIHVPDVKATVAWYESIGFVVGATHEEPGCPMDWASLRFGASEVMLSAGGKPPTSPRRDFDLYVHVDTLEEHFHAVAPKAEIVEGLHATEYGMRSSSKISTAFGSLLVSRSNMANKAPEPTSRSVTIPAEPGIAPARAVAHL
jgi:hypothetical protein